VKREGIPDLVGDKHMNMIREMKRSARPPGPRSAGFTLIELMVVVIIVAILASVAVPIYLSQTRRAKASEALAALGSIRKAEEIRKTETGAYLDVASGDMANEPSDAPPGLGLDFTGNTYIGADCMSVAVDATQGFIATCAGSASGNTAPRSTTVAGYVVEMRANGQARSSFDGGTNYTNWE